MRTKEFVLLKIKEKMYEVLNTESDSGSAENKIKISKKGLLPVVSGVVGLDCVHLFLFLAGASCFPFVHCLSFRYVLSAPLSIFTKTWFL